MIHDFRMIQAFYRDLASRIDSVRKHTGHPLTLAEKILYTHLSDIKHLHQYKRGTDYATFCPDRVAMQDATAQMALLQFMLTGRNHSSVQWMHQQYTQTPQRLLPMEQNLVLGRK